MNEQRNIIEETAIESLIGEYVAMRPDDDGFIALCPFHDDGEGAFYVDPEEQWYSCQACGAAGDAMDFVMAYYGEGKYEALHRLEQRKDQQDDK